MAVGGELPETGNVDGGAMYFPVNDWTTSSSPLRMPRRLRKRLSESKKSSSTVEEIEVKLREANLRRQKFYQKWSSKARQKPRSPSQSSLHEEDLGQRLEAELQAAEQKRCQKQFVKLKRTTLDLAKTYDALNINEKYVKSMPFEQLALLIKSTTTLPTLKVLLDRIESSYKISLAAKKKPAKNSSFCWDYIDHLVRRVDFLRRKATARKFTQGREGKKPASTVEASKSPANLSRYEASVVLFAYMILGHPNAVFKSGMGEREIALAKSAEKNVRELELLIKIILGAPIQSSDEESGDPSLARRCTLRSQIAAFDAAWCSYLNSFVVWKVKDVRILEKDLVRAACQLELSMIQTCKLTPEDSGALTHGTKAIQKQVLKDQKLLREKVHDLTGDAGIERMEDALSDTRKKYFQERNDGSSIGSPITHISSPDLPSSSDRPSSLARSDKGNDVIESSETPSQVIRSLFKDPFEGGDSATPRSSVASQLNISGEKLTTKNELIAYAAVHREHYIMVLLPDSFSVTEEDKNSTKAQIREMMEKAFWDEITESMKKEEPNYVRAIELMKEVRDEICEIAPQNQKQKIGEDIDVDILCQVLKYRKLDLDFVGFILELAITFLGLSIAANEDELKAARQKLLKQLAEVCEIKDDSSNCSHVTALINGLRFVLEQMQVIKQEMSKSRITLLKGPAGLDYLKGAFTNRLGPPSDALTALPLTMRWLFSVGDIKDQEWEEHTNALSELTRRQKSSSLSLLPSSTLRTGGSISAKMSGSQLNPFAANPTEAWYGQVAEYWKQAIARKPVLGLGLGNQHSECKGEDVDLMVRLGLLKLVSGVSGVTQEALPETLKFNLFRLRGVQSQLQKIIVISTSALVLRQTLLSEQMVANPADMEVMISSCIKQLSVLHDATKEVGIEEIVKEVSIEEIVKEVGIEEIVEVLGKFAGNESLDNTKLQSMKSFMARIITKSLQAGDAVFVRVSRAVYLAARGVVLGGSGAHGRELAEAALQQVGAAVLVDKVVQAATGVMVVANVSVAVHGPWYVHLIENM